MTSVAPHLERVFLLPAMSELRLVTPLAEHVVPSADDPYCVVKLLSNEDGTAHYGSAVIDGYDLRPDIPMRIPSNKSLAVFSHDGCRLAVNAPALIINDCYVTSTGQYRQRSIVELHAYLESKRKEARSGSSHAVGPRVLVCSSRPECGKSTLVRTLANYAVALGYHPLVVDLDATLPSFGMPQCTSLFVAQYPIDPEEDCCFVPMQPFLFCPTSTLRAHSQTLRVSPCDSRTLWRRSMNTMADVAMQRVSRYDRTRCGGILIDYPSIEEEQIEDAEAARFSERLQVGVVHQKSNPLDVLLDTAEEYGVDHIICVGSDWLQFKLQQLAAERSAATSGKTASALSNRSTVWLPLTSISAPCLELAGKTIRVVPFDAQDAHPSRGTPQTLSLCQKQKYMNYFFGTITSPLKPVPLEVSLNNIRLVQLRSADSSSMQTLLSVTDAESKRDPAALSFPLPSDVDLEGRVLAVSSTMYLRLKEVTDESTGEITTVEESVPHRDVEAGLKTGHIIGFIWVTEVSSSKLLVVCPNAELPQPKGICLYLTNIFFSRKKGS